MLVQTCAQNVIGIHVRKLFSIAQEAETREYYCLYLGE